MGAAAATGTSGCSGGTIGGNNPSTATLRALVQYVDYSNTAVKGWKLPVASAKPKEEAKPEAKPAEGADKK